MQKSCMRLHTDTVALLHESTIHETTSLRQTQRYLACNALLFTSKQSVSISMTSDSSHSLFCSVSHHRCGKFISLPCHSQDPAAAGLQIWSTLVPENVYLAVSPESRFLLELSVWSMTRHTPVAVHLNLLHYLPLFPPLVLPRSFAFAWLKVIMRPRWKRPCLFSAKARGSGTSSGIHL